jgi:hypothetical protein
VLPGSTLVADAVTATAGLAGAGAPVPVGFGVGLAVEGDGEGEALGEEPAGLSPAPDDPVGVADGVAVAEGVDGAAGLDVADGVEVAAGVDVPDGVPDAAGLDAPGVEVAVGLEVAAGGLDAAVGDGVAEGDGVVAAMTMPVILLPMTKRPVATPSVIGRACGDRMGTLSVQAVAAGDRALWGIRYFWGHGLPFGRIFPTIRCRPGPEPRTRR